jgi:hydroxymethylglutaryl-CoA lyase
MLLLPPDTSNASASHAWPQVVYSEEVMREGFGIESAGITLEDKLRLLDALADAGLRRITVGAFVSPRYVPQMAGFEDLLRAMKPRPNVQYLTFMHNRRARELAARFAPPLTLEDELCTFFDDLCDVHQRRNMNRSVADSIRLWPQYLAESRASGINKGRVAIASAWGSNFLGPFTSQQRLAFLEKQIHAMQSVGIEVVEIGLHDSQSWCLPHLLEADLTEIRRRWPWIRQFHLHMHNARGMALPCLYTALRTLDSHVTLIVDGTLGGIGGGQYCGNGTASGMVATEDFLHMLQGMGIETGVDFDRLVECVWILERVIGHSAFGHVSRAGPRPVRSEDRFDANLPAIESLRAARHFRLGAEAYRDEGYWPWRKRFEGPWFDLSSLNTTPDPVSEASN